MDRPKPNPELFNGPLFVGSIVTVFLFGGFIFQVFRYSQHASTDRWPIKALVAFVTATELGGVLAILYTVYVVLCRTSLGPDPTFAFPSSGIAIPILNALTSTAVQIFFAWRIYSLSRAQRKQWPLALAAIVVLLALTQLASNGVVSYQVTISRVDPKKFADNHIPVKLWNASAVTCDAIMSGTLIYLLYQYRRGVRRSSKNMVNTLIRHTVENGLITVICVTIQLIVYSLRPHDLVHVAFAYIGARLYANVLMTSLNARRVLRTNATATTFTVPGSSSTAAGRSGAVRVEDLFRHPTQPTSHSTQSPYGTRATDDTDETRSIHLTTLESTEFDKSYGSHPDHERSGVTMSINHRRVDFEERDEQVVKTDLERVF